MKERKRKKQRIRGNGEAEKRGTSKNRKGNEKG
jgi:hypothetical protein